MVSDSTNISLLAEPDRMLCSAFYKHFAPSGARYDNVAKIESRTDRVGPSVLKACGARDHNFSYRWSEAEPVVPSGIKSASV